LDAVPFIGRNIYTGDVPNNTDGSTERTHLIVQALRQVLLATAPDAVFLVEASEAPERVQRYLDPNEAQLAYGFHATMALWATVASEDPKFLLAHLPDPAPSGHMLTPVRTHDGILLESGKPEIVEALLTALLQESLWPDPIAREVWQRQHDSVYDVPGRTLSLLGDDPRRVLLIYFLAACLPGYPMVYYGDELGLGNNLQFMQAQQQEKAARSGAGANVGVDFREINRGPVRREDLTTERAKILSAGLENILKKRPDTCVATKPEPLSDLPTGVFGVQWERDGSTIFAYANLRGSTSGIDLPERASAFEPFGNPKFTALAAENHLQMPAYAYTWLRPT